MNTQYAIVTGITISQNALFHFFTALSNKGMSRITDEPAHLAVSLPQCKVTSSIINTS